MEAFHFFSLKLFHFFLSFFLLLQLFLFQCQLQRISSRYSQLCSSNGLHCTQFQEKNHFFSFSLKALKLFLLLPCFQETSPKRCCRTSLVQSLHHFESLKH